MSDEEPPVPEAVLTSEGPTRRVESVDVDETVAVKEGSSWPTTEYESADFGRYSGTINYLIILSAFVTAVVTTTNNRICLPGMKLNKSYNAIQIRRIAGVKRFPETASRGGETAGS
jgi:hypothetical protein